MVQQVLVLREAQALILFLVPFLLQVEVEVAVLLAVIALV